MTPPLIRVAGAPHPSPLHETAPVRAVPSQIVNPFLPSLPLRTFRPR